MKKEIFSKPTELNLFLKEGFRRYLIMILGNEKLAEKTIEKYIFTSFHPKEDGDKCFRIMIFKKN